MTDRTTLILEEVEVLVAELAELKMEGPRFRILHRFHELGTDCCPGEEIAAIWLVDRRQEYHLRLTDATLTLFDYLARHNRMSQTGSQLARSIAHDQFCLSE